MHNKPVVFISSTSDLGSARDLVGKVLYSMGYEPVWQDIEATDGGELLEVLRKRIEPSALLIQLVGARYGAEPPTPTPEFGRVSYTQYEALYAERLGRKVVYHFMDPAFPADPAPPESDECRELQVAYRRRIEADNKLHQSQIASTQDLELSIRRITDELAAVRKLAERRFRKMLWLAGAAIVGLALVTVLVLAVLNRQAKTEAQLVDQASDMRDALASYRDEILAAVAPKPVVQGQSTPEPLPPDLIEKAKILLARGNAEDQALANIALKKHAEADRIIQDLKNKPGNPIDDAFRLLTLEGDNWYQANQPDKAIEPYEQALALRINNVDALQNVAMAHISARQGNITDHQRRAIEIAEGTLKIVAPGSANWAMTQNNLGAAWSDVPTGDKSENLRKAIAAYEAALTVYTIELYPDYARSIRTSLSWYQVMTRDFRGALATTEAAAKLVPPYWPLETNHAHALLFLDRTEEAEAIYLEYVDKRIGEKTWQEVILQDFDDLEKEGLTHPQMQTVRALLQAAK